MLFSSKSSLAQKICKIWKKYILLKKFVFIWRFHFSTFYARARQCARAGGARISSKNAFFQLFWFICWLFWRANARAILKLFPMDLYDKIEVICTINHYHNVKIDEFTICWIFVENRFFRKFWTFFSKNWIFWKMTKFHWSADSSIFVLW